MRNDCSPHGVGEAFQKHHQGEPHWHYLRNEKNLGGYDNIRACTEGARGRYVLMISDDDWLVPDAFAILDKLLALADQCQAPACFVCDRLNRKYGEASILGNPFAWLRDVSVNVPAFISRVIWRRPFWEAYAYEAYPPEMSLPQLDCFLDACLEGPIVAGCRDLVEIGTADNTDRPSYWFYTRHAPVDCYEYPNLYRKVLGQGRPDLRPDSGSMPDGWRSCVSRGKKCSSCATTSSSITRRFGSFVGTTGSRCTASLYFRLSGCF